MPIADTRTVYDPAGVDELVLRVNLDEPPGRTDEGLKVAVMRDGSRVTRKDTDRADPFLTVAVADRPCDTATVAGLGRTESQELGRGFEPWRGEARLAPTGSASRVIVAAAAMRPTAVHARPAERPVARWTEPSCVVQAEGRW